MNPTATPAFGASPETSEWLEPDGLGGFAMGTARGVRTRRYHAALLCASADGRGRFVLCNGFEVHVEQDGQLVPLSTQIYAGDVVTGAPDDRLLSFDRDPWPRWRWRLPDGTVIEHELFVAAGAPRTFVSFRLVTPVDRPIILHVRPLLSCRGYHSLHHENGTFRFAPVARTDASVRLRPYDAVPGLAVDSNGRYEHNATWYRQFLYRSEFARGLDCLEDLASPGVFTWQLGPGGVDEAALVLARDDGRRAVDAVERLREARARERARRKDLGGPLDRAANQFVIRNRDAASVIAGYPWFVEWGRDTFVSLRGLLLATGRLDDARAVLLRWVDTVSRGMLPNHIPEDGGATLHNTVDASLWFVIAAHAYLTAARGLFAPSSDARAAMVQAIEQILSAYASGTRFQIRATSDGLITAGDPGSQLTWMDARVDGRAVTPRVGKPVEVQALWLNALFAATELRCPSSSRFRALLDRGYESFQSRFWNAQRGALYDVVDVDHVEGTVDARLRPNQIFAVGGLPLPLLDDGRARSVVDVVEAQLFTPLGLRTLAPGEPGYVGRYDGDAARRDGSYHQGAAWPWLMGAFVEAWVRVRGGGADVRRQARARFLPPLLEHFERHAGLGGISELVDADFPHRPGGCPFQAWSVAELVRLDRIVLAAPG